MASILTSARNPRFGDEVYVAAVALKASKGPAQLLMSTVYSLNFWDFSHFMVIVKPNLQSQAVVFDFQPQDPENVFVALSALSGNKVPGVILTRNLTKLPKSKCWFVGSCKLNAVDAAQKFNQTWQTDLAIGIHDCRDYTNGLVEFLTGKNLILEHLRTSNSGNSQSQVSDF